MGDYYRVLEGDTRSLDYGSYRKGLCGFVYVYIVGGYRSTAWGSGFEGLVLGFRVEGLGVGFRVEVLGLGWGLMPRENLHGQAPTITCEIPPFDLMQLLQGAFTVVLGQVCRA